ncbi:MAG: GatB/YqeY domain-containing protein [Acidocella sp.]|nr:GatB/YqeY domain-containing protein [Acidocella sp.]
MNLRETITAAVKTAMLARDAERTSTLRLIQAKLKDTDIAARPKGVTAVPDDEIFAMLRSMIKSRRDSVTLFRQGHREELAAKEEAEIAVIEEFLPQTLSGVALDAAIDAAIAETNAASPKDMGKVIGALKAKHGAALDMGVVSVAVKAKLG